MSVDATAQSLTVWTRWNVATAVKLFVLSQVRELMREEEEEKEEEVRVETVVMGFYFIFRVEVILYLQVQAGSLIRWFKTFCWTLAWS